MNDFYNFLQEEVENTVKLREIKDLPGGRWLILGANQLNKLNKLLTRISDAHQDFECIHVANTKQAEFINQNRPKDSVISWKNRYSLEILNTTEIKDSLDSFSAFLFVSTNPINLRDLNIIEIAQVLSKAGVGIYVFDYGMEEIYEYTNLPLFKKGLEVYVGINDFIGMALDAKKEV